MSVEKCQVLESPIRGLKMFRGHFFPLLGGYFLGSDSARGLDDLPEEILLYVASFLTVKDILSLSRTNKVM
jgi:hypothetical protein